MSERKVISKYYPPDFDPSKIGKRKKLKKNGTNTLPTVRLMAPFSMRCTACGEYIYKSRKFNARKEDTGDRYLGVKIFRFYIRCPRCSGEIRFRTDPKTSDYKTEFGAVRNYDPKVSQTQDEKPETMEEIMERLEKAEAEEQAALNGDDSRNDKDVLAKLEEKLAERQREEAEAEELDEIQLLNARRDQKTTVGELGDAEEILSRIARQQEAEAEAEDAEAARQAFRNKSRRLQTGRELGNLFVVHNKPQKCSEVTQIKQKSVADVIQKPVLLAGYSDDSSDDEPAEPAEPSEPSGPSEPKKVTITVKKKAPVGFGPGVIIKKK